MSDHNQSFLPGVYIPWLGPIKQWTKRDSFILTKTDSPLYHNSPQIQASFSLWRNTPESFATLNEWQEWCADYNKISDEPSKCGKPELENFIEHRHDQALLSLLCLRDGLKAFDLGNKIPAFDSKDPCAIARYHGAKERPVPFWLRFLQSGLQRLEIVARKASRRDVFS